MGRLKTRTLTLTTYPTPCRTTNKAFEMNIIRSLFWVSFLIAVSADDRTILTSVDSDPKSFDQVLCSQAWVESCSKVRVDFRKIGKSSMMLPVGGKFSKSSKVNVMFVSPDLNMTYYQA